MKLLTAQQMRWMDANTIEKYGIPGIVLMENAGINVFKAAVEILGDVKKKNVLVLCGSGNNGGDGYVAARHLSNNGACVRIVHYGDTLNFKGDAAVNYEIAVNMHISITQNPDEETLWKLLCNTDLVIDALLGTGSKGAARYPMSDAISMVNSSNKYVLSVDLPSGIDSDTGALPGEAIVADTTVTFALPKLGMLTYPAAKRIGKLIVADISIPDELLEECECAAYLITKDMVSTAIPERESDSHKGTYGHLAVVAGSIGMTGAATLVGEGALRIGTGLVTIMIPKSLNKIIETKLTEAMSIPIPESSNGAFGMCSLEDAAREINSRSAAVIGPGLGRRDDTAAFVRELIACSSRPMILDADALYAISKDLSCLKNTAADIVITPHPGEMSMLTGLSVSEVQADRIGTASKFAKDHGVVVVLKGAATVVATPDESVYINSTGCSGMASGGVGDVLSGMIGGLIAQGIDPELAAVSGVYLHGLAGEIASEKTGEAAMLASDLVAGIGNAVNKTVLP